MMKWFKNIFKDKAEKRFEERRGGLERLPMDAVPSKPKGETLTEEEKPKITFGSISDLEAGLKRRAQGGTTNHFGYPLEKPQAGLGVVSSHEHTVRAAQQQMQQEADLRAEQAAADAAAQMQTQIKQDTVKRKHVEMLADLFLTAWEEDNDITTFPVERMEGIEDNLDDLRSRLRRNGFDTTYFPRLSRRVDPESRFPELRYSRE